MRIGSLRNNSGLAATTFGLIALAVFVAPPAISPAVAEVVQTPVDPALVPPELPVEIETELAPAASLKQAPLWKELKQLLDTPYAPVVRRPSFLPAGCGDLLGAPTPCNTPLPPLNVYGLDQGVLTDETLRLRTSDGEISWDQTGLLFDPDFVEEGLPDELIPAIGELFVDPATNNLVLCNEPIPEPYIGGRTTCEDDPSNDDPRLPPDGTVVAVPAFNPATGKLEELEPDGSREEVAALETPINEADFLRKGADVTGPTGTALATALRPYLGRLGAETLGKAMFWDMQVGSDGIQACGSCHFAAGVDTRIRNQLNPNHLGGDGNLEIKGPNGTLAASDFPFRKLNDPGFPSEGGAPNEASDSNDVMSSMGVRFRQFVDIPLPGTLSFGVPANGVRPLLPDIGLPIADPLPIFQGLRRVEPRNTPTMIGAAFNFDNFWDGRARFHFNGGSVFGPADPQFHIFFDPGAPGAGGGTIRGASNGDIRTDYCPDPLDEEDETCDIVDEPVRIKFSSLASLSTGPALSDFEMSFSGRNWAKLGKKLLQGNGSALRPFVTPLANQLVSPTDSRLGRFSNQGGPANLCSSLPPAWRANGGTTAVGKPGLCINYRGLIQLAFKRQLWHTTNMHLNGSPAVCTDDAENGVLVPATCDPFDGYKLTLAPGAAVPGNRNQFTQMEANMSLFFGLSLQLYFQLLIPDNTPFDQFMDAYPLAANAVGQPGEQGVLPPSMVRDLVGGELDPTAIPGFGPDEIFGFDIFAGGNLTAALPVGSDRNPTGNGSNPFLRTGRCMLCHLGPEQTDHTVNVNHGLILSDTEFELPPTGAPEPTGPFKTVSGFLLEEEVAEVAQDGVEVENRNFAIRNNPDLDVPNPIVDDPATDVNEAVAVAEPSGIAFQDNGVYNIGVRPSDEDIGRGGLDPFGWPLSLAAMALKNLAGAEFEPCDAPDEAPCEMDNFEPGDPLDPVDFGGGLFEETGEDMTYPGCTPTDERSCTLQDINPGLGMEPDEPELASYLAPWTNNLPAGELHPQIDELAFAPNTVTPPPFAEFGEVQGGSDLHCATYDPEQFGVGGENVDPNFGWGPLCPNSQSAIPNNIDPWLNGTWPVPNRVARDGAFKAPQLRNVELTGPYFHSGSYLTLRQVVDFYFRGGDFPVTNEENRDPNLVAIEIQAFGLGATAGLDTIPGVVLDGVPDTITMYGPFPYQGGETPEPATGSVEDVKDALVKFLISLTDNRVKLEQAPFDRPELYIPINGRAPDNLLGRLQLVAQSSLNGTDTCTAIGTGICFRRLPAVGAAGHPDTPLQNFLDVSSTKGSPGPDHFDPTTTP